MSRDLHLSIFAVAMVITEQFSYLYCINKYDFIVGLHV